MESSRMIKNEVNAWTPYYRPPNNAVSLCGPLITQSMVMDPNNCIITGVYYILGMLLLEHQSDLILFKAEKLCLSHFVPPAVSDILEIPSGIIWY